MIPALLGLREKGRTRKATPEVQSRVLNLLEIAAPTQGVEENKPEYAKSFRTALGLA